MKITLNLERIKRDVYSIKRIVLYTFLACLGIYCCFTLKELFFKICSCAITVIALARISERTIERLMVERGDYNFVEEMSADNCPIYILYVGDTPRFYYAKERFTLNEELIKKIKRP